MRQQFQNGSLRIRKRVRLPSLWEFRYRVTDGRGRRTLKSVVVGNTTDYPTAEAVRPKLVGLVRSINTGSPRLDEATVNDLIDRFISEERLADIVAGRVAGPEALHYSTAKSYLTILNRYLRPRWGGMRLTAVRPAAVQDWLNSLTASPKSKAHIKGLLRRLFEKAMLWEMLDLQRNPLELVEIKGVSKRRRMPTVLAVDQYRVIVQRLREPYRTMVMVAQCTGLRASEILGLQWGDFDFGKRTIQITRAVVNGRVNRVKTEYSEDLLPMATTVAETLLEWRKQALPTLEDWVFPNPVTLRPYYASSIEPYLEKIGQELGLRLGWHTFRHTYRSWLDATGAPIGVQQKLMRHANVSTTMNIYGNALMESKRDANNKVVCMALENGQTS